jgi:hemerythrin
LSVTKIVWDDSLSTGEPSVDLQHRYLIKTINELAEAIDQGKGRDAISEILVVTQFYAEWHFQREEECMERYRCPAAAANKSAHAVFIEKFRKFREDYESAGATDALAARMYAELGDWLVNHILKVDKALAAVVPQGKA